MINSHIIPAYYLEQFSTPSKMGPDKPGRIWIYDKGKEPDERATSVQGRQNGYFAYTKPDGTTEETFEEVLAVHENECNDILVCARSPVYHWPRGSREKMAFYAAMLYSRATQRRAFNEKNHLKAVADVEEAMKDAAFVGGLAKALSSKLGVEVKPQQMREGIAQRLEEAQTAASSKNAFITDLLDNAKYIASLLLNKQPWRIVRPSQGAEFVTTDNPLMSFVPLKHGVLHPGYGFGNLFVDAAFPLSPDACLLMGNNWQVATMLNAEQAQRLNEGLITVCDRYVYSKTRSDATNKAVQQMAGDSKYGVTAFMPVGLKLPDAKEFLRHHFGVEPESSRPTDDSESSDSERR